MGTDARQLSSRLITDDILFYNAWFVNGGSTSHVIRVCLTSMTHRVCHAELQ